MATNPEVVCVGMSVVDVLAQGVADVRFDGSTNFVRGVGMWAGGDALNEAVTLARLGHSVALMTLVGDDAQGKFVLQECARNGVDTGAIATCTTHQTTTTIVLIGEDGERSFITQRGGTMEAFSIEHVDMAYLREGTRVVCIGSLFCSDRLDRNGVAALLKRAKQAGAITVADLVPNRAGARLSDIADILPLLDYIVPSIEEAVLYTGRSDPDEVADVCIRLGVKNVVIKMGSRGAYARSASERIAVPAYPAVVVDTTGAGDNFVAGFISGLLRNCSLLECLKLGSATASVAIQSIGANSGVQSLQQVMDVITAAERSGA
jgi:sugar/nucleoside kinase (ribokinase family)